MSAYFPETTTLPIVRISPEGEALLRHNPAFCRALSLYALSPHAYTTRVPEARLLGAGRFSFTFEVGGAAIKFSSPYSSRDSFDHGGKPFPAEDLALQYDVLYALGEHLAGRPEGVTTPEQYLALRTADDTRLLGQEYMNRWRAVEARTIDEFGDPTSVTLADERRVASLATAYRRRLREAVRDFKLRVHLNDLSFHRKSGIHGGNILVPDGEPLDASTPLCIIDQPAPFTARRETMQRR